MNWELYWGSARIRRIVSLIPLVIVSGTIFYLSSIPADELPDFTQDLSDKVLHIIAYFVYGIASQFAVVGWFRQWSDGRVRLLAFTIGFLFSVSDELHQLVVPGRHATHLDVVADVLGLVLALWCLRWTRRLLW